MVKYIIIGVGIAIIIFFTMHLLSKISDKNKNKVIASIFGVIAIGFVVLLMLLIS